MSVKTPKVDPKLITALKALLFTFLGSGMRLGVEYGLTIGAAALVGLAHNIPGVFESGSAGFAVLASVRYFLVLEKATGGGTADVKASAARSAQLQQSQQLLDHLAEQIKSMDTPQPDRNAAGPYL